MLFSCLRLSSLDLMIFFFFSYFTTLTHSSQLKFPMPGVWRGEEVRKKVRTPQMVFWCHPALPDSVSADCLREHSLSLLFHSSIRALQNLRTKFCVEGSPCGGITRPLETAAGRGQPRSQGHGSWGSRKHQGCPPARGKAWDTGQVQVKDPSTEGVQFEKD